MSAPKKFKDSWSSYLAAIETVYDSRASEEQFLSAEFMRGELHSQLATDLTNHLSDKGFQDVNGKILVDVLRDYHFFHVVEAGYFSNHDFSKT